MIRGASPVDCAGAGWCFIPWAGDCGPACQASACRLKSRAGFSLSRRFDRLKPVFHFGGPVPEVTGLDFLFQAKRAAPSFQREERADLANATISIARWQRLSGL